MKTRILEAFQVCISVLLNISENENSTPLKLTQTVQRNHIKSTQQLEVMR